MPDFSPVYPILRLSKQIVVTGLDFYEMKCLVFAGYDVYFQSTVSPIATDNLETMQLKPVSGHLFAGFPKFVVCGHFCFTLSH
jgi:hypothetical protein